MPRTKMPRKKSSIIKKNRSLIRTASASVECLPSSVSREPTTQSEEDFNSLISTEYESEADFQKAFEAYYDKRVEAHKKKYETACEYVKNYFSRIFSTYPESYLNLVVTSPFDESSLQDQNIDPNIKASSGRQSRLQKKEPSEFKRPKTPPKDRTSRKRSLSAPAPASARPPSASACYKTPLNRARQQMAMIKTITPKVSNTPISVMRRPQHGEVAFSTSGSPLLIGPVVHEEIPTVSVPLLDGRIFSILPDPGLPPPDLPEFDDETKKYLQTLREHLAILAPSSP